jgi:hypothetical protein
MKKYLIVNGKTIYLKLFTCDADACKWSFSKCDNTKHIIIFEYNEIIEFERMTINLN